MNDIPLDLTSLPTDLIYHPNELERWLDETSAPLSDDDIRAMSAYFDSESFQFPNSNLCDIIDIDDKIMK